MNPSEFLNKRNKTKRIIQEVPKEKIVKVPVSREIVVEKQVKYIERIDEEKTIRIAKAIAHDLAGQIVKQILEAIPNLDLKVLKNKISTGEIKPAMELSNLPNRITIEAEIEEILDMNIKTNKTSEKSDLDDIITKLL